MVPEGSSPETYDPTPQQMVSLSKSTAYLRIGYIGFEQSWIDKLQENLRYFCRSKPHSSAMFALARQRNCRKSCTWSGATYLEFYGKCQNNSQQYL
jgi:histidinol-phosphate/aromatic aminotransferase/cobyric acid decarboxylase-like protein